MVFGHSAKAGISSVGILPGRAASFNGKDVAFIAFL
jgi:hypothetical protein